MTIPRRNIVIAALVLAVAAAVVFVNLRFQRTEATTVNVEPVRKRDLEAVVSASGKIQPKRSVNISADTMGRVTLLDVNEGDRVARGQFLLQIDPRNLQTRVQSGEAGLRAAESALEQAKVAVESSRTSLALARENQRRQRELWARQLTTREALDRAENEVQLRETELREREQQVRTQELRLGQERATLVNARYDLSKVRIESPIDGIVTRRNIEEGETVVIGTMNNPGTVLLTIADMSVIEAEVEVDETDIPSVSLGQLAKIAVDALPDRTFRGRVTEIGNSPIQATGQTSGQQATNFKVVVTIEGTIPDVRPGFTCTADITTATRKGVLSVPIQATTVREVVFDAKGNVVREPRTDRRRRSVETSVSASEAKPGQTSKAVEGVFAVRDGVARFLPIKTGIAGDRFFEVLSGLKEGDQVIVGPFNSVRELADGVAIKVEQPARRRRTSS
jgi:HlyD family secretion protein